MASAPRELHPALQFLKDNAVVLGLVLVVAASVAVFAISQAASAAPAAAPSPRPTAMPTVGLGSNAGAATSPSAGPSGASAGTGTPEASAGAHAGAQPSSQAADATPTPTMAPPGDGASPQGVTVKDWHPAAEGFSAAWANTAGGKDAWLARIKPFVTPALYAQFGLTDVRNIAPDTLDHVTLGDEAGAQKSFHAWFTTGGHRFDGLLEVQNDGTWRVTQIASPRS